jgi:hypothetical protein
VENKCVALSLLSTEDRVPGAPSGEDHRIRKLFKLNEVELDVMKDRDAE